VGVAALLVAHWVAVGLAARGSSERALDGAQYQSPRDGRLEPARARGDRARDPQRAPTTAEPSPMREPPAATVTPPPPPPRSEAGAAQAARTPTTSERATAASERPATLAAPAITELASEVRLLREAEVALSTDPVRALARLEAHVRQFPRTSLALERQALQILARCAAAPGDAAIHERDAFVRDHPGSAYAPRVRAACR
jgi:hypothetical protein